MSWNLIWKNPEFVPFGPISPPLGPSLAIKLGHNNLFEFQEFVQSLFYFILFLITVYICQMFGQSDLFCPKSENPVTKKQKQKSLVD